MGMCWCAVALSDANIARILADPPLVWQAIAPDDPEMYEDEREAARPRPSLIGRLFGKRTRTDDVPPLDLGDGEGIEMDLDKAWHGLHYLLTGTAWAGKAPENFIVAGGREVGTVEVGYGPARALTADETRAVADVLDRMDDDTLRARFDPADMTAKEIYPDIWDRDADEDDTLGYVLENAQALRDFLAQATTNGVGMVTHLS